MRFIVLSFIVLLTLNKGAVNSVKIIELRVSAHIAEGSDALLGCRFDMESDTLYSLKWYKDGREFYRYVPKAHPSYKVFYVPGVVVDLNRSSTSFVSLKKVTRVSGGVYRCEVYGEAPDFTTVSREKEVVIDLLPTSGPSIFGIDKEYHHGSQLDLNCTSGPSRPEAQLIWYINGVQAPNYYVVRPIQVLPTNHPHAYMSIQNIHFTVRQNHFIEGVFAIKCQATIPPLYHEETEYSFYDLSFQTTAAPEATTESSNRGNCYRCESSISYIQVIFLLLIFFVSVN